jgi:dihydroorotate dehydrogenase electron transfer subunit
MTSHPAHRGTLAVEAGEILIHQALAGNQYLLRLAAPVTARRARAGHFIHLQVDRHLAMRRPLSLLRVDGDAGWIEIMYKVVGNGTRELSQQPPGCRLSLIGPIGKPFQPHSDRRRPLLIGGGIGMPPMIFLADQLRQQRDLHPFVILGSEVPFPFTPRPSTLLLHAMPAEATATLPLLEEWSIPCRLASRQGYPGCFDGYVTDLARHWIESLTTDQQREVEIFACGPHAMLEAVARLARSYDLPCQVSLEEYMACAVGGCAGCVVEVMTANGPTMQRVCVDGPVFDARAVFA